MFNLNINQFVIFIFIVLLFLSKTCIEYYIDCNGIRGKQPDGCTIMTQTECSEWANNMSKNYEPNNDVFCGVTDSCPIGCYVHNGTVYYGASKNKGKCNNQRVCIQKNS